MSDSALRGLDVVSFLAASPQPRTVKEVSAGLQMSRATVTRILDSLHDAGWIVETGKPRRYSAGLRLASVGVAVLGHNRVRELLQPYLHQLASMADHPTSLVFYEPGRVIVTDTAEVLAGRLAIRVGGGVHPLACTSSGLVFLAAMADEEAGQLIAEDRTAYTARTKTDPEEILDAVRLTRLRGYAATDREYQAHASGIAVPVYDSDDRPAASFAVSLRGPLTERFVAEVLQPTLTVASRASLALGHHAGIRGHLG